jgi:hypothetical protein
MRIEKKHKYHLPQPSIMVSTRAADHLEKNTSAAIGGDNDGSGSSRGAPGRLARLLPGRPVVSLPGNNKEEAAIAAAIDYTASLNFDGNDINGNNGEINNGNDSNDGNGIGAGGGGTTWGK